MPLAVVKVELSKLKHVGGSEPQPSDADVDCLGVGGPSEAGILERCGIVGPESGCAGVARVDAAGLEQLLRRVVEHRPRVRPVRLPESLGEDRAHQGAELLNSVAPSPASQYGLMWWLETTPSGDSAYAARGFGGQLIVVVPVNRLVVAVASQPTKDCATDSQGVFALVSDVILTAFH